MKYISTRGGAPEASFEEVLLRGWAPDGGLYMPVQVPQIGHKLRSWAALPYVDLCFEVMSLFIGDEIPPQQLKDILRRSFSQFSEPEIVPIERVGDVYIAELFHGPTLAFKDLAMQVVGNLLKHFLSIRREKLTVIVGTSGDTGPAAGHAVAGSQWIDYLCLYPRGRVSSLQELQMTSIRAENVKIIECEGTSDDLDEPIKEIMRDVEFKKKWNLSSINSINWARVMIQSSHYIYTYLRVRASSAKSDITFSVPSGALGNLTGGVIAQRMGLPVKLVAATNENDITTRFAQSGVYQTADSVKPTIAPAIDIQAPYNIERILFLLNGGNTALCGDWMKEIESSNRLSLPHEWHNLLKNMFTAHRVTEQESKDIIRDSFAKYNYVVDPHTAVGVVTALRCSSPSTEMVVLATAHPSKCEDAVVDILKTRPNTLAHPNATKLKPSGRKIDFFSVAERSAWLDKLKNAVETHCGRKIASRL